MGFNGHDFAGIAEAEQAERERLAQLLELHEQLATLEFGMIPSVEVVYHRCKVKVAILADRKLVQLRFAIPLRSEAHTAHLDAAMTRAVIADLELALERLESPVPTDSSEIA